MNSWQWHWLGMPLWISILLWILGSYGLWIFYRKEWQAYSLSSRIGAWILRCLLLGTILFMLAEPIITQKELVSIKPLLSIIIDDSGSMQHNDSSMHPTYQFDEMQQLNLISKKDRPYVAATCARLLKQVREALSRHQHKKIQNSLLQASTQLQDMQTSLIGHPIVGERIQEINNILRIYVNSLEESSNNQSKADIKKQGQKIIRLIDGQLIAALDGLQQHSDSALNASAESSQALTQGMKQWKTLERRQRARAFVQNTVIPKLSTQIEIKSTSLQQPDTLLTETITTKAHNSDFYKCLDQLNKRQSSEQQQQILILSDGIHNGDKDPLPLARALGARDIPIHSILVGDPDQPRDASILEIIAPSEIYRADDIPLSIRFQIVGFPQQKWNLKLVINGNEYEQRIVVGNNAIQEEDFTISGFPISRLKIEASLKPYIESNINNVSNKAWLEEMWLPVKDGNLINFFDSNDIKASQMHHFVASKNIQHNRQDHFIRRLRSYLVPEESGYYQFAISGDDQTQFWLSTDFRTEHASLIAYSDKATKEQAWETFKSQISSPIYLQKDQAYFIELRQHEGLHFDHIHFGWKTPNKDKISSIPDSNLIPYGDQRIAQYLVNQKEHNTNNNSKQHIIVAHSDPLRILILDQYPRWETRLINALLKDDDGLQIDHLYFSFQQDKDQNIFNSIDQYDALILGDLSSSLLNNEIQDTLAQSVREQGLLLMVIAGRQSMPHDYALGALADILPVSVNTSKSLQDQQWTLSKVRTDSLNRVEGSLWQWQSLPPLQWINSQVTAKPEATTHIQAQSKGGPQVPFCCSQHVGAGRVIYFGSDETWRWRQLIGKQAHRKWWRHVLQWGLQSRLHGSDPRLRASISRRIAQNAKQILVHARCIVNGRDLSNNLKLSLEQIDGQGSNHWQFNMPPSSGKQSSLCIGDVVDLPSGQYRCSIRAPEAPQLLEQREFWIQQPAQTELNNLGSDKKFLQRISKTSGGRSAEFANSDQLLLHLQQSLKPQTREQSQVLHVWRSWYLLLFAVMLLAGEWLLRKRVGLP